LFVIGQQYTCPSAKRAAYTIEDKFFQKLFFRTLSFLTLEEVRSIAAQAPIPIFVKDENSVYKWANHAFCSFILDATIENLVNKRVTQVLCPEEGEAVLRSDAYVLQREGAVRTFELSVKSQQYKVMKMYTRLRDGTKVLIGAVGSF
jgi:hypothetical protein